MRFSHWLKTVASALLLSAAAGPALAQGPGTPGGGQPTFQPAYGANDPGVLYPQGVPQGYQPYPAISPYGMGNVAWDQTFRDNDGLWFERILNTKRTYFGSLDVTHNRVVNPGRKELGSPHIPFDVVTNGLAGFNIPTYGQGSTPGGVAGAVPAGGQNPLSRVVVDSRVIPYPMYLGLPSLTGVGDINSFFPIRGLNEFGDFKSVGLQASLGFFNEDGSGMAVNGFWTGVANQAFDMGEASINGIAITQDIILASGGALLYTRNGAIPLDWGYSSSALIPNVTGHLGTTKYDLLFHMDTRTSTLGTDVNFYMPPVVQREAFKLRTLIGGRYLNIDQQFRFVGIDSGFNYPLTNITGNAGGGAASGGNTFRPDPGLITVGYDLYTATLSNSVQTNLAGPQVGLRYDFGEGKKFKIWGQSIVGLMANHENYSLHGNNIGDEQGLLLLSNGIDMLATDARFSSTRSVSHVSPLFEQSVNTEINVLERLPIIRRVPGIQNTMLRFGYTMTVIGQVARPGESIDWRGFPGFPSIHPDRSTWWNSRFSFGIEKRF